MNKYLKIEMAMSDGTKKTVSFKNPVADLAWDTIQSWFTWIMNNNIFLTEYPAYNVHPVGWVSAYYEENIITEITE